MKPVYSRYVFALIVLATFCLPEAGTAQLRAELPTPYNITGPTIMTQGAVRSDSKLFGLLNMRMGHSYEMTMGSFGGQMYNQNMYTNTVYLDFNERMNGRFDVAFAHSPFGNAMPGMNQTGQVFVRNAEFNYKLNDRTQFSFRFQQVPGGMGMYGNPFGYGYGRSGFHQDRFQNDPFYNSF
jgi:hypothetical protein